MYIYILTLDTLFLYIFHDFILLRLRECVLICVYPRTCVRVYVPIVVGYVCVCVYVRVYVCVCLNMCVCTRVYVHVRVNALSCALLSLSGYGVFLYDSNSGSWW